MINVNFDDAVAYCNWLSAKTGKIYRLPTESQWEYAARGGNKSYGYTFSGSDDLEIVGWYESNSGRQTQPVGGKNPNELGLYDMSGNVLEWCRDWFGEYNVGPQTDPQGSLSGEFRILRGGCWYNTPVECRLTYRSFNGPASRFNDAGFRVIRLQ